MIDNKYNNNKYKRRVLATTGCCWFNLLFFRLLKKNVKFIISQEVERVRKIFKKKSEWCAEQIPDATKTLTIKVALLPVWKFKKKIVSKKGTSSKNLITYRKPKKLFWDSSEMQPKPRPEFHQRRGYLAVCVCVFTAKTRPYTRICKTTTIIFIHSRTSL